MFIQVDQQTAQIISSHVFDGYTQINILRDKNGNLYVEKCYLDIERYSAIHALLMGRPTIKAVEYEVEND